MGPAKTPPPQPKSAGLRPEQMRAAIPKIRRRIAELEEFDPSSIRERGDPRLKTLQTKLDDTITEIFGSDTIEAHRFRTFSFDGAGIAFGGVPISEVIQSIHKSKARELANLNTIIELFNEKISDSGDSPVGRAIRAFADLDLHPEIERAAGQLFHDGHYANAVEDACKVLDMLVKLRSMRADPSGTELMQLVFSPNSPILKFNDQTNASEKSEQQGMMYLYAGAMLALRNPRAHGLVNDHPERAIEYLSFLSMLAKALDRTRRA